MRRVNCDNCNHSYDSFISNCPKCGKPNNELDPKAKKSHAFFLDPIRQICLMGVGLILLQVFAMIISSIFMMVAKSKFQDSTQINEYLISPYVQIITMSIAYLMVFAIIIAIVFPFIKYLVKEFKYGRTYLWGVLGGIFLILFSILYNVLVSLGHPIEGNQNQTVLEGMVLKYPVPSFLLFALIGPIVEEFTYRVGLFSLTARLNRIVAYIVTALVFGFIHFDFSSIGTDTIVNELLNLPVYVVSGLALAFVYERGSWTGSSIAHIINNMYGVAMIIISSHIQG